MIHIDFQEALSGVIKWMNTEKQKYDLLQFVMNTLVIDWLIYSTGKLEFGANSFNWINGEVVTLSVQGRWQSPPLDTPPPELTIQSRLGFLQGGMRDFYLYSLNFLK